MLTPRTSRRLTLQQQRDMLTGDFPENLLFGESQTANTSTGVPGTGFESLFNRSSQTYSNEAPSILQNIGIPSVEAPPASGLPREPQSIQDIDTMYRNGEITKEQADQYELLFSNQRGSDIPNSNIDGKGRLLTDDSSSYSDPSNPFTFPLFNSAGSDLSTELYSLGMGIGAEPGTKGRGATIAGSAGAAALDIAGTVLSGVGFSKRNRFLEEEERRKQQEVDYTPNSQTANSNITGGLSYGEYGGLFYPSKNVPKYPDGGVSSDPPVKSSEWNMSNMITDPVVIEQFKKDHGISVPGGSNLWLDDETGAYTFFTPLPTEVQKGNYRPPVSKMRAPVVPVRAGMYRSANTGQPLPDRGSPGQVDYQYAQFLDEFASSPEMVAARNNQQSEIERNKALLQTMSEEQKADMRSKKMTPSQYLSPPSGNPSFENGGEYSELFGVKKYPDGGKHSIRVGNVMMPSSLSQEQVDAELKKTHPVSQEWYTYPGRPEAIYRKVDNQWFISPQGKRGDGVFVPVQDPNGDRYKELNSNALPLNSGPYMQTVVGGQMRYMFRDGGEMNGSENTGIQGKKVGDPIKFNYGGEMISGKIKKIENGQIYLE